MTSKPHNTLAAERRKARHYGMQALYQWYMANAALNDIDKFEKRNAKKANRYPRDSFDTHENLDATMK